MNQEQREELASLYALGLLDAEEAAAFQREMKADPAIAALVDDLAAVSVEIGKNVPQYAPPAHLRAALLERISSRQAATTSSALRWLPWAAAAGFAIFSGVLWQEKSSLETRIAALDSQKAELETRISTLEMEKSSLNIRVASLEQRDPLTEVQSVTLAPQQPDLAGSQVVALWDEKRQAGVLKTANLPAPANGKVYQVWVITPKAPAPVSAGVLTASTDNIHFFRPVETVGPIAAIAISIEPTGGSASPTGPVVLVGKL